MAANEEQLKKLFYEIDADKSGKVDVGELKGLVTACNDLGLFEPKLSEQEIQQTAEAVLAECDEGEKDGKLTLDEFVRGMKKLIG